MAAGRTYTPIATTTLGSAASSVTFSSIASTYTDLVLIISCATASGSVNTFLELNGDTGTTYSETALGGNGTNTTSARWTSQYGSYVDYYAYPTTTLGDYTSITHLMNYSNTTTYKTVISRASVASRGTDAVVNIWRSTAAINSIKVKNASGTNYAIGSTFTLYGIVAA